MDFFQLTSFSINLLFAVLLFAIAFLYSSVGHGGASAYLMVMALIGISPLTMKPMALLLNILVSGISFIHFFRAGHFSLNLFLPFALASVPASFFGGQLQLETNLYRKALGASLIVPALGGFLNFGQGKNFVKSHGKKATSVFAGAAIGLASGIMGIGGGIFLSPLILLLNWANMKETACTAALFIFVNSISALLGHASTIQYNILEYWSWAFAAFAGGLLGSYTGSRLLGSGALGYALSLVLLAASFKLMFF